LEESWFEDSKGKKKAVTFINIPSQQKKKKSWLCWHAPVIPAMVGS
jgi:hypothetical protein